MKPEFPHQQTTEELLSIPTEQLSEVRKVFEYCLIQHSFLGKDQSGRAIYFIRYTAAQRHNVVTIREGLRNLERTNFFTEILTEAIKQLFLPTLTNKK